MGLRRPHVGRYALRQSGSPRLPLVGTVRSPPPRPRSPTAGTLRQFTNELMDEEIARLKLGYLVQAEFLEDPPDTYEHAFRVKPESVTADSWILCPDSVGDSEEWISVLKA